MPKNLPVELIYLLIAAAVLLFNYVTGQAAKRRRSETPPDEPPQAEPPDDEPLPPIWGRTRQPDALDDDPLPTLWGRTPPVPATMPVPAVAAESARRSRAPATSTARSKRRYSRQSLMGTRRDVQNAIVVAAIVGPCRAFEPHDVG